jgi:hypothetical protein
MPVFNSHTAFEIRRGVKAFLNLEASLTRNGIPGSQPAKTPGQVADKDEEISRLQAELARLRSTRGASGPPVEDAPIFFLIGRSKSGTSWLMRLLDSHPEILCRGEGMFFERSSPRSLLRALSRSEEVQRWLERNPWTRQAPDASLESMLGAFVRQAMRRRLEEVKRRTGTKRIVGDKSPFKTPRMVEEISTMCPEAKVVHIVRDGRDVVVSSAHHRWNNATDVGGHRNLTPEQVAKREAYRSDPATFLATGESIFAEGHVAEIARSWSESVGRTVENGASLGDNYHELRYEDLLAEPVAEVRRLLEFLGADSSEKVARECVEVASFEQLSGGRAQGEEDSSSFYRKGVAGDWKNHFTEEDRRIFKEEAGELLIQLGYEKDLDW